MLLFEWRVGLGAVSSLDSGRSDSLVSKGRRADNVIQSAPSKRERAKGSVVSEELNPALHCTRHDFKLLLHEFLDGLGSERNYIRGGCASVDAVRLKKKDPLWKTT